MLFLIEKKKAFFVVREKHKILFEVVCDKGYNNPSTGIMADQIIRFKGYKPRKQYPKELRRVVFYDKEGNRTFVFYTNSTEEGQGRSGFTTQIDAEPFRFTNMVIGLPPFIY